MDDWLLYGFTEEEWKSLPKSKRYRIRHPEKSKEATKKWADASKEYISTRHRKYDLKKKYNLTEEDYSRMLLAQGGKCGICEKSDQTGKWQRFGVDHCHQTGKVRELLCNECNRGIGLLKDSTDILQKAINYLTKHKD